MGTAIHWLGTAVLRRHLHIRIDIHRPDRLAICCGCAAQCTAAAVGEHTVVGVDGIHHQRIVLADAETMGRRWHVVCCDFTVFVLCPWPRA